MIDDPLSLLSLGIWLMAAGMYPVGFLFGACSACCEPANPFEDCCPIGPWGGQYPSQLVITMTGAQNRVNFPGKWRTIENGKEEWINCNVLNATYVVDFTPCSQSSTAVIKAATYRQFMNAHTASPTLINSQSVRYLVTASYACNVYEFPGSIPYGSPEILNSPLYSVTLTVETGHAVGANQYDGFNIPRFRNGELGYDWPIFAIQFFSCGVFDNRFCDTRLPSGNWSCTDREISRTMTWRRTTQSSGTAGALQYNINANGIGFQLVESGGTNQESTTRCATTNEFTSFGFLGCDLSGAVVDVTVQP